MTRVMPSLYLYYITQLRLDDTKVIGELKDVEGLDRSEQLGMANTDVAGNVSFLWMT